MEFTVIAEKPDGTRVARTVPGETIDSVIWDLWAEVGFRGYRLISISRPMVLQPVRED